MSSRGRLHRILPMDARRRIYSVPRLETLFARFQQGESCQFQQSHSKLCCNRSIPRRAVGPRGFLFSIAAGVKKNDGTISRLRTHQSNVYCITSRFGTASLLRARIIASYPASGILHSFQVWPAFSDPLRTGSRERRRSAWWRRRRGRSSPGGGRGVRTT